MNSANSNPTKLNDLKIVHINLAARPLAANQLVNYLNTHNNYLVSINEPPVNRFGVHSLNNFEKLIYSKESLDNCRACVVAGGPDLQICRITQFTNEFCVTCQTSFNDFKFIFVSIYMHPTTDIEIALNYLSEIILEFNDQPIIIQSDTNSRHSVWDRDDSNPRGEPLLDFIMENSLIITNDDLTPTFHTVREKIVYKSAIDLCICNQRAYRLLHSTVVDLDTPSLSDHRYLITKLNKCSAKRRITKTTRRFSTRDADWQAFQNSFRQRIADHHKIFDNNKSRNTIDQAVDRLQSAIERTCRLNLAKHTKKSIRRVAWLDEEIQLARTKLSTLFRKYRNSPNDMIKDYNYECYRQSKAELKKLINRKKLQSWKTFCEQATSGNMYQVFSSTKRNSNQEAISTIQMDNGEYTTCLNDTAQHLLDIHFPDRNHPSIDQPDSPLTSLQLDEIERVTACEITKALEDFSPTKSPGVDGISSDILLNCARACPWLFENLFNDLIEVGYFPKRWKFGVVCMLPKTSKILNAKSYRPITLLVIIGKCLERIINNRLIRFLHQNHLLNKNQFGFTKQKSVEDALENLITKLDQIGERRKAALVVSFDIAGAFDNVPWYRIIDALEEKNCPVYLLNIIKSYLSQRRVELLGVTGKIKTLTQGSPQGSVLGPTLFNLAIDSLLDLKTLRGTFKQAFADDFLMVIETDLPGELDEDAKHEIESKISKVLDWGTDNHLEFNSKKTQAMFISKRTACPKIELMVGQHIIRTSNQLKYLGVILDEKLNFAAHIADRISKARQTLFALRRICSKTWGINPILANHLYGAVVQPKVAFASEIWAHRCNLQTVIKSLRRFQRQCAIVACKAYCTVRTETVLMMQHRLPLDRFVIYKFMSRMVKKFKNLNDIPVETPVDWLNTTPPWRWFDLEHTEYSDRVDLDFDRLIYVDGTEKENRVGGSYLICTTRTTNTEEQDFRLPYWCSVFQAKVHAINLALDKLIEREVRDEAILIICNDKNVLLSINNSHNDLPESVRVRNSIHRLYELKNEIKVCYFEAGHQEDPLFRATDRLAKEGSCLGQITFELEMRLGKAKRMIRDELFNCWRSELPALVSKWSANFAGVEGLTHVVDFYTSQFITAHGCFGEYKSKFKLSSDPNCIACGSQTDNPKHVLFDCEFYREQRTELLHSNGISAPKDLIKLRPCNPNAIKQFRQFCKFVVLHRQRTPSDQTHDEHTSR